jgi:hypothetical protein
MSDETPTVPAPRLQASASYSFTMRLHAPSRAARSPASPRPSPTRTPYWRRSTSRAWNRVRSPATSRSPAWTPVMPRRSCAPRGLEGVRIDSVSDRTFLMHERGRIEVNAKADHVRQRSPAGAPLARVAADDGAPVHPDRLHGPERPSITRCSWGAARRAVGPTSGSTRRRGRFRAKRPRRTPVCRSGGSELVARQIRVLARFALSSPLVRALAAHDDLRPAGKATRRVRAGR